MPFGKFKPPYTLALGKLAALIVLITGLEDRSSMAGRVIPKTQKEVLDPPLLNTKHYKERIKGKVEQSSQE